MYATRVRDIPEFYQFVSQDQEVNELKSMLPPNPWAFGRQFDSFFVWQRDGELVSVFGMFGIVPGLEEPVFKVL